jgi:hypothetical protein
VTSWGDRSVYHNDATIKNKQLGPECQVGPIPHTVNGIDLPYFSAPVSPGDPNHIDETLDVDLSFLVGTGFTIFAVERRWADYPNGDMMNRESILGTTLPAALQNSGSSAFNEGFSFGYVYYNWQTNLSLDQVFDTILGIAVRVPSSPPLPLGEETAQLDKDFGQTLWANGIRVADSVNLTLLTLADGGAIGRAFFNNGSADARFRGDIAEVIVYDTSLDDPTRIVVEGYLKNHWQY